MTWHATSANRRSHSRALSHSQTPPPPPPPQPQLQFILLQDPLNPADLHNPWRPPASPILPPPPPPPSDSWDFWDPFAPSSHSVITEEDWEEMATNVSEATAPPPPPPPPPPPVSTVLPSPSVKDSELAMVVAPRSRKDLAEVVRKLDEYFLKAAGARVSTLLEAPDCLLSSSSQGVMGKIGSYGRSLSSCGSNSSRASSFNGFTKFERQCEEERGTGMLSVSHSSTVDKLYAWEKKLYLEVKVKKNKREIEMLESKMMVASQAMEATSSEITRLRESELLPQRLDLLNGSSKS